MTNTDETTHTGMINIANGITRNTTAYLYSISIDKRTSHMTLGERRGKKAP